ncbi:Zeatin O-glucosyltransferase [Capsicum annuum]|uniref:Zeatin O-glucosyltransferase n=1 Tax=Capsicum annuum TaxID=4072 RepID=A0A2G2YVL6_CAPAN|nr:Zeatin O-glucosyltransferase [Capsicum annuum]
MSMGVPLATWPVSYDQPFNAIFVTNLLKIGIPVKRWSLREELVTASTIELSNQIVSPELTAVRLILRSYCQRTKRYKSLLNKDLISGLNRQKGLKKERKEEEWCISMGVPLATWPIHHDQPFNAILVTNLLKTGTSVRSWTRREELVTASTIEKAVNTLMGTTEGEEMRQRTVELRKKIKSSVSDGEPAREAMESFISNIIK